MEGVALSLNRDLELVSKCVPLIVKAKALRAIGIAFYYFVVTFLYLCLIGCSLRFTCRG
jgi:hypothetical protein